MKKLMPCLYDNKVCSNYNKKCKECKLEVGSELGKLIKTQEEYEIAIKTEIIKEQLPKKCRDCNFIEIIDLNNNKVRCPYMLKRCILND